MKTFLIFGALALVAALTIGSAYSVMTGTPTGNVVQVKGGVQEVVLTMKDWRYETIPAVLEPGVPVRMTVDLNEVQGCMRDVVIPEYGVRKLVSEGDNVIEFTPTKTGAFAVSCSMGMGQGTITVGEESLGAAITGNAVKAGSCGTGGCGCGA